MCAKNNLRIEKKVSYDRLSSIAGINRQLLFLKINQSFLKLLSLIIVLHILSLNSITLAASLTSTNIHSYTSTPSNWSPLGPAVSGDTLIYGGDYYISTNGVGENFNVESGGNPIRLIVAGNNNVASIVYVTAPIGASLSVTGGNGSIITPPNSNYINISSYSLLNTSILSGQIIIGPGTTFSSDSSIDDSLLNNFNSGQINFGSNSTFYTPSSNIKFNPNSKIWLGNNNTFTFEKMKFEGLAGNEIDFGNANNIQLNNLVFITTGTPILQPTTYNVVFPSGVTLKVPRITLGNRYDITFNNIFDSTISTEMSFMTAHNNRVMFGPNSDIRLSKLELLISANNFISIAKANPIANNLYLYIAGGGSFYSNNHSVTLPPNAVYSSFNMQLSKAANNQITFGDNSTFSNWNLNFENDSNNNLITFGADTNITSGSIPITFIGGSSDNQINFGDNSTFSSPTGNITLSSANTITFGNNNTFNIKTLNLSGITSSNLVIGSNNNFNPSALNFMNNNDLTFAADTKIRTSSIRFTGSNNNIIFNNQFDETQRITLSLDNSIGKAYDFSTPVSFSLINFNNACSNNQVTLGPVATFTEIRFNASNNNLVSFAPGTNIITSHATPINLTSLGLNNQIIFGDNSTFTAPVGTVSIEGANNKLILGNNNTFTAQTLLLSNITSSSLALGSNGNIITTNLNFINSNNFTFVADATIKSSSMTFTGSTNNVTFNNQFDETQPIELGFIASIGKSYIFSTPATFSGIVFNNASNNNQVTLGPDSTLNSPTDLFFTANSNIVIYGDNNTIIAPAASFTDSNGPVLGTNNTITIPIISFFGTNNSFTFGAGNTINSATLMPGINTNVDLICTGDLIANIDNIGSATVPITNFNIDSGEVNLNGTALYTKNINFSNDGKFKALTPHVFLGNVTTAVDEQGNLFLSNADITDIGTAPKRLNNISFVGTATDKINLGGNLYSKEIYTYEPELILKADTFFNGQTFSDSTIYSLSNNTLIFNDANNSKIINDPMINFTIDDNKHGSLVVTEGILDMNSNGMNKLTLKLTDVTTILLPPTLAGESYTILGASNLGQINIPDKNKVEFVITRQSPFVVWSYSKGVVTRVRLGQTQIEEAVKEIVKSNGGSNTAAQNAALISNPNNDNEAAALFQDFHTLIVLSGGNGMTQAVEALNPTVVEAAEQISEVNDQALVALNARLGNLSSPNSSELAMNEGDSGVAAGDNLYNHGVWVSVLYGTADQINRGESPGYKNRTLTSMIGIDTMITDEDTIGTALSYADNEVKHKAPNSGDTSKVKSYTLSLYGTKEFNGNWFAQGIGLISRNKIDNKEQRFSPGKTEIARGSFNVNAYQLQGILGRRDKFTDQVYFTSTVGAEYLIMNSSKYKETGTTNQNLLIKKSEEHRVNALAGGSITYNTSPKNYNLALETRGNISYNIYNKPSKIMVQLDGLVGDRLVNKTVDQSPVYYNLGASLSTVKARTELSASYDFFIGKGYIGHLAAVKIRFNL